MLKRSKLVSIIVCMLLVTLITPGIGFAYIYFSAGFVSPNFDIENRSTYSDVVTASKNAWNATPTPTVITEVPGSGHNWIDDDSYTDSWYGMYQAESLQYIITGRATKFHIKTNRRLLVDKSSNFRQSVIVHELGHALCLQDNPSATEEHKNDSIMNENRVRDTLIKPTQDDINGVNNAYGAN